MYIYIYISRLFRKLICIAECIYIFYGGKKNVYPMLCAEVTLISTLHQLRTIIFAT